MKSGKTISHLTAVIAFYLCFGARICTTSFMLLMEFIESSWVLRAELNGLTMDPSSKCSNTLRWQSEGSILVHQTTSAKTAAHNESYQETKRKLL
uniref:Uncharacterized protein n=1 Tax=Glossina palpalis gambiensis TaxID=67801 RepID=A0A1B0BIB8_9MUSC